MGGEKIEKIPFRMALNMEFIDSSVELEEENGKKIVALDYEYYHTMAEKKTSGGSRDCLKKYKIHKLLCVQRVGYVEVGEIALRVVIYSRHRKEGLKALDWFISELKNEVPIWKWGVSENGQRFST